MHRNMLKWLINEWHGNHLCLPQIVPVLALLADLTSLAVVCNLFEDPKPVVAFEDPSPCLVCAEVTSCGDVKDKLLTLLWQNKLIPGESISILRRPFSINQATTVEECCSA